MSDYQMSLTDIGSIAESLKYHGLTVYKVDAWADTSHGAVIARNYGYSGANCAITIETSGTCKNPAHTRETHAHVLVWRRSPKCEPATYANR